MMSANYGTARDTEGLWGVNCVFELVGYYVKEFQPHFSLGAMTSHITSKHDVGTHLSHPLSISLSLSAVA